MAERLTDEDLDGIARFGVAIESDQQAMAAELLDYRQAARATDKESLTVEATAPDLDELARLLGAATPGPWQVHREDVPYTAPVGGDCIERTIHTAYDHPQLGGPAPVVTQSFGLIARPVVSVSDADARLIAAAVNALPALLATARRERRMREARDAIAAIPIREEWIGGQREQYVPVGDVLYIIDAALAEEGQDG